MSIMVAIPAPAPEVLRISYSMASTYLDCPRKYYLKYIRKIAIKPTTPALFGSAMHTALDAYFFHRQHVAPIIALDEAYKAFDGEWPYDDPEDPVRTRAMAHKLLKKYNEKYATDGIEVIRFEDRKVIEFPLDIEDAENPIIFVGKIDKIIKWDRMTLVMEHKTSKMIILARYSPNLQVSGYVWLGRQLGYKIAGALLDVIQTAATKQEMYRDLQTRQESHDEEFVRTIKKVGRRMRADKAEGFFEPNFDSCTKYGECPYRSICKEDPRIQEDIIRTRYISVDPTVVEGE